MAIKAFQPTVQDKVSKCNEIIRNIKQLCSDKECMKVYLDLKEQIRMFRTELNADGLTDIYYFIIEASKTERAMDFAKLVNREIVEVLKFEQRMYDKGF